MPDPTEESSRWRRKSPEELSRDALQKRRAQLSPLAPAIIAILFMVASFARDVFGWKRLGSLPVEEALRRCVFAGIIVFVLAYLYQLIKGSALLEVRTRLTICTKCFDVATGQPPGRCLCGGILDDADRWTWNRCAKCGFDLRGSERRCPECGAAIEQWPVKPPPKAR